MFPWEHLLPTLMSPKMERSETPVSNYRIQLDPGTHAGTDAVHWRRSKHLQQNPIPWESNPLSSCLLPLLQGKGPRAANLCLSALAQMTVIW